MTIRILAVGKLAKSYLREGVEDYSGRIRRHCKFEILEVPEQDGKCNEPYLREDRLLFDKIDKPAWQNGYCIALSPTCQERQLYSSEKLAARLAALQSQGHSSFCFIIGGTNGLGPAVLERADLQLSFSPLTFPHQLFRLMLCEQIYRCLKINSGQTYHK
ncbi:23S rRNA (pseudouridine(1915)-N(3))-methyltransferase RlmH [Candidatus Haliotispira prima]|uniref:Ribosomal RNA large subunit methyltransferase H n=1 Tax=Candidatus Haliotispira prima TaxID=3034016 RepID=A0ABY8MH60_9SPIO|nr:23S rRNA (pseudouridine(1915)-N(3))-methyltransferase RlmH [Candidatus Haliotispira prima]